MNRYGTGPGLVRRKRSYMVEAEDLFNDLSAAVEDRFPGIVLEITDVYEDE